jgi:hypothetical protein
LRREPGPSASLSMQAPIGFCWPGSWGTRRADGLGDEAAAPVEASRNQAQAWQPTSWARGLSFMTPYAPGINCRDVAQIPFFVHTHVSLHDRGRFSSKGNGPRLHVNEPGPVHRGCFQCDFPLVIPMFDGSKPMMVPSSSISRPESENRCPYTPRPSASRKCMHAMPKLSAIPLPSPYVLFPVYDSAISLSLRRVERMAAAAGVLIQGQSASRLSSLVPHRERASLARSRFGGFCVRDGIGATSDGLLARLAGPDADRVPLDVLLAAEGARVLGVLRNLHLLYQLSQRGTISGRQDNPSAIHPSIDSIPSIQSVVSRALRLSHHHRSWGRRHRLLREQDTGLGASLLTWCRICLRRVSKLNRRHDNTHRKVLTGHTDLLGVLGHFGRISTF